jgi:large subunit ribosomal protein L6
MPVKTVSVVRSSVTFGKPQEITVSRVGKRPIAIPDGVTVTIKDNVLTAKKKNGELTVPFSEMMNVVVADGTVTVTPTAEDKTLSPLWGLTRALIQNALTGVNEGWKKTLEIYGVGYRAQLKGKSLDIQVGQSHPIVIEPPTGITFTANQESIDGQNVQVVQISGIDKQLVGDVTAKIRDLKPPEPYKGKGIRYRGEYVRRKAGKATG